MRSISQLLRREPRARVFFAAHAQSSFGTGAGYVALLLLAYERFHSPWALTLILLAEFLPAALLAPVMGALADRWPRRRCLMAAEVLRAGAFAGLAVSGSFGVILVLALLAGVGNALFAPAVMASLPSLVSPSRLPAATSLYGALEELGYTVGPGLAAVLFLLVSPATLLLVNGVSFAVSALALSSLRFGAAAGGGDSGRRGLWSETRAGVSILATRGPLRALLLSSTAFVVCLGMVNVGELLLARSFGASDSQFSLLVAIMAVGVVTGSLLGSGGGRPAVLKARYLAGLLTCGVALVLSGSVPTLIAAVPAFFAIGVGNGVGLTYQRLLVQSVVGDDKLGRVFGMTKCLASWGMIAAFFAGGALGSLTGARWLFILAGAGALVAWSLAASALRGHWTEAPATAQAPAAARSVDSKSVFGTGPTQGDVAPAAR